MSELTAIAVNAQAEALSRLLDGGFLRLYEGERVLAELRFADPASGPARDGVVEFSVRANESALATGGPDRYQALRKDGAVVLVGTVGVSGADIIVRSASIVKGARVSVGKFFHKVPR